MESCLMGRITPQIQKDFEDRGFAIVPDVLSAEDLSAFRQDFDDIVKEEDQRLDREGSDDKSITVKGKKYFVSFPHLDRPQLKKAFFNETMEDIVGSILGETAYFYWDQCVIKFKDEKSSFAWHQDSGYGPVVRPHAPYLTCWLALDDVTVENGTVYMMPYDKAPASRGHIEHVWSDEEKAMVGYQGDELGEPVIMKAGSLAIFSSYTLHRSGPNTNGQPRRVYYMAYTPQKMKIEGSDDLYGHNYPFLKDGKAVYEKGS